MVPEPGLSLQVVLFRAQCDKPGVSISTSGQCLFQSQMDNTVKSSTQELEVVQIPQITKQDTAKHFWPQRTSIPNEILWFCKCMACKWNLPWPTLFADTINTVYVGFGNQKILSATFTVDNSFVYFTVDEQQAIWIFAQFGRTQTDKVQWFSPIYGKQLACDCGQSMCHAELDELMRELVMSGAMANPDSSPLLRRTSRPFLSVF